MTTATAHPRPATPATICPPTAIALRVTELASALPGGFAASARRARAVAELAGREGWGEAVAGVLAWRPVDWAAVCRHLRATREWKEQRVRETPLAELENEMAVWEKSSAA